MRALGDLGLDGLPADHVLAVGTEAEQLRSMAGAIAPDHGQLRIRLR